MYKMYKSYIVSVFMLYVELVYKAFWNVPLVVCHLKYVNAAAIYLNQVRPHALETVLQWNWKLQKDDDNINLI